VERKGTSALTYKHAISDPLVLFERQRFYASAKSQGPGIHKVYTLAEKAGAPQLSLAKKVFDFVSSNPPAEDSPHYLAEYMRDTILSQIPRKTRYDDSFWCCLLYLLDKNNVPNCEIGGVLHSFIYKVYDDFDPQDVLDG